MFDQVNRRSDLLKELRGKLVRKNLPNVSEHLALNGFEIIAVDERAGCCLVPATAKLLSHDVGMRITATAEAHLVATVHLANHDHCKTSPLDFQC